jgi:hypothetical protein
MDGARVEAIIDGDVAGERIVDALLGFDRHHHAPAGHVFGPLDGVDPDIGAAVDRDHPVAVVAPAQIEQPEQQIDLVRVVRGRLQELKAGAEADARFGHVAVEPVHDQRAVIGRRGDECDFSRLIRHGGSLAARSGAIQPMNGLTWD